MIRAPMLPALRRAGYRVERGQRPRSRGMRYVISDGDGNMIAVVYSRRWLHLWTEHLVRGAPQPPVEVI